MVPLNGHGATSRAHCQSRPCLKQKIEDGGRSFNLKPSRFNPFERETSRKRQPFNRADSIRQTPSQKPLPASEVINFHPPPGGRAFDKTARKQGPPPFCNKNQRSKGQNGPFCQSIPQTLATSSGTSIETFSLLMSEALSAMEETVRRNSSTLALILASPSFDSVRTEMAPFGSSPL